MKTEFQAFERRWLIASWGMATYVQSGRVLGTHEAIRLIARLLDLVEFDQDDLWRRLGWCFSRPVTRGDVAISIQPTLSDALRSGVLVIIQMPRFEVRSLASVGSIECAGSEMRSRC